MSTIVALSGSALQIVGGGVATVVTYANRLSPAPISLQAIVEELQRTGDGFVVKIMEPAWLTVLDILNRDPQGLLQLTSRQFEELIAGAYDKAGYDEVTLTPRSGDRGRDVIAIKKGFGCVRILDQVKLHSPGNPVTANDVRALLGVLGSDRNATKGVVTTTSMFAPGIETDPTIAPFVPYRLELIDGPTLVERLKLLGENAKG